MKYFELHISGLGRYVIPLEGIGDIVEIELDMLNDDQCVQITPVKMTKEEYKQLPEFQGF